MRGAYINLDRCVERRQGLLARLEAAGLPTTDYLRIPAIEPAGDEPQLNRGLNSKGELGIWRSLIATFDAIAAGDFTDVVHVVEDDAAFADGIAGTIERLAGLMGSASALADADIVFLDYHLNRDLFAYVIDRSQKLAPAGIELMPASTGYMACCSSFLVRRSAAAYLSALLGRILDCAETLSAVDLTLRSLFRLGAIRGFIVIPLAGASFWEHDAESQVQSHAAPAARRCQRAYMVLKLLASGLKSPFWCAERLCELYGLVNPLTASSTAVDFLTFFDAVKPLIAPP